MLSKLSSSSPGSVINCVKLSQFRVFLHNAFSIPTFLHQSETHAKYMHTCLHMLTIYCNFTSGIICIIFVDCNMILFSVIVTYSMYSYFRIPKSLARHSVISIMRMRLSIISRNTSSPSPEPTAAGNLGQN